MNKNKINNKGQNKTENKGKYEGGVQQTSGHIERPNHGIRSARRPRRWSTVAIGVLVTAAGLVVADEAARAWAAAGGIDEVKSFASKLTNYVTAIAASVAVLFMAISGVRWTMSSGNPAKQADAKSALVSAAAGLAIALSANVIVSLVVAALQ